MTEAESIVNCYKSWHNKPQSCGICESFSFLSFTDISVIGADPYTEVNHCMF